MENNGRQGRCGGEKGRGSVSTAPEGKLRSPTLNGNHNHNHYGNQNNNYIPLNYHYL